MEWRLLVLMPRNEIWVEKSLTGLDRKATILHEMAERREMEGGMDYSDAHNDYANPPEIVARTNPNLIDKLIADEMGRYEKSQPKLRRRNESKKPLTVAEIEKQYEKYDVPKEPRTVETSDDEIAPKYYLGRKIQPKVEANVI